MGSNLAEKGRYMRRRRIGNWDASDSCCKNGCRATPPGGVGRISGKPRPSAGTARLVAGERRVASRQVANVDSALSLLPLSLGFAILSVCCACTRHIHCVKRRTTRRRNAGGISTFPRSPSHVPETYTQRPASAMNPHIPHRFLSSDRRYPGQAARTQSKITRARRLVPAVALPSSTRPLPSHHALLSVLCSLTHSWLLRNGGQ